MHCSCSTTPPLSLEWYSFCIACTWCFVSCTYLSTCFYYDRECSSCALYLMTYLPFRTIFWPVGVWQELVRNHLVTFRVDHCTSCCSLYNNPLTWTCMFSMYSIIMRVCFRCEYFQLPSFGETSPLTYQACFSVQLKHFFNIQVLGHVKTILILVLGFTVFNVSIMSDVCVLYSPLTTWGVRIF
jgi:hypothetical protein